MDFIFNINTPKDTPETSPQITNVKLTRGRLFGGFVYFPSGPAGLLHLTAQIGIHQIIPYNTGENIRLDDCIAPLSIGINLDEPPFDVDILTWNDSTEYDHSLTVCLSLIPSRRKRKIIDTMSDLFAGTKGYHKP